jgi:very-short-patch-repair endonuclease
MTDIEGLVHSLGGMAHKRQLVARGARDRHLTLAVRSGEVIRVRNGWYSTFSESDERLRAVRVGGRLTGSSAVVAMGAWVLGDRPLHVSVHGNAARLRDQYNRHERLNVTAPRGVVLHWDERDLRDRGSATSVGLMDALRRVVLDEAFEDAVAVLDWALHTGALDRIDFEGLILSLPEGFRGISGWVDDACESLPESLSRTRLRLAGRKVETQVRLGDLQRIDLVVDDIAAVEVDGDKFHRHRFEEDRSRDVDITLQHLHSLRPSARMVFYDWDRFARAVDVAISLRRGRPENSGVASRSPFSTRGMTGWRRGTRHRSPEFSKRSEGRGNSADRRAGWPMRE